MNLMSKQRGMISPDCATSWIKRRKRSTVSNGEYDECGAFELLRSMNYLVLDKFYYQANCLLVKSEFDAISE